MPRGHLESGDHQSTFSTFFPFDSFVSYPADGNDASQFPNGAFLPNDDRTLYNTTSSDYQPIPSPEVNGQYLKELENDKWFLLSLMQAISPPCFYHATKLLDDEIARIEAALGRQNMVVSALSEDKISFNEELPPAEGDVITVEEKVVVPVDTNPEYNFIGRLMGPRGMTIKRLEQETGCRLLVRGRGSIKNAVKEDMLRQKLGFEHLNENLHILVQAKDAKNRAQIKLSRGVEAIKQMLTPVANDELKQRQMRELAIINGTYRPVVKRASTNVDSSSCDPLQNPF